MLLARNTNIRFFASIYACLILCVVSIGCRDEVERSDGADGPSSKAEAVSAMFVDVTKDAGVAFVHESGARGQRLNPETFGPGAGWLDYDGDRWPDLLLVNGNSLVGEKDVTKTSKLYRNRRDGTFGDVTREAGLDLAMYGMGFVSADMDSDGDEDIFLYGLDDCRLLRNDAGRFVDVTGDSGLPSEWDWVGAAAFFDYDLDGELDLFVGGYVDWSPDRERDDECRFGTAEKQYCPVAMFPATAPRLFRGVGGGKFADASATAGLSKLEGKALGVVAEDYDRDGYPDLLVANDSVPNFLLVNLGDGRFEDRGLISGFATDGHGAALAGMGIDSVWTENDGPLVVAIGNFSGEPTTVHVTDGQGYFVERSLASDIGKKSLDRVTFGLVLEDFDLDGEIDLLQVNGHVFDLAEKTKVPYQQVAQLFRGREGGAWSTFDSPNDALLSRPRLGRALAAADYDRDGDLDVVITENQGQARLFRNDGARAGGAFRVRLRATKLHRDAIGAEVEVRLASRAGERRLRRTLRAASSYFSQCERVVTFGLRSEERVADVTVRWPGGYLEDFESPDDEREIELVEGKGRVSTRVVSASEAGEKKKPASIIERRRQGDAFLRAGKLEAALSAFEEVLSSEPADFVAWRAKIETLYRLRRAQALETAVKESVARFESANLLVSHFALVFRQQGLRELSARFYREAVRIDTRRHDVWTALGNIEYDRGRYGPALELFARALEIAPRDIEALTNSGKVHALRKEWDEAERFLSAAVAESADHGAALSTLGTVALAKKDTAKAEEFLRRAANASDRPAVQLEAYGNLGMLYASKSERTKAIECFERVLEIDPNEKKALRALEALRTP